jgi:carbon storage regulator CsrA
LAIRKDSIMLVLTRKLGEQIRVGDDITFAVLAVRGNQVRLGIEAPRWVRIARAELGDLPAAEPLGSGSQGVREPSADNSICGSGCSQ